jgi:hypothetical protein
MLYVEFSRSKSRQRPGPYSKYLTPSITLTETNEIKIVFNTIANVDFEKQFIILEKLDCLKMGYAIC